MKRATKKDYNPCGGCYYGCDYEVGKSDTPCETVLGYKRAVVLEDIIGDNYDLERLKELVEADRNGRCVVLDPDYDRGCITRYLPLDRPNKDEMERLEALNEDNGCS